MIRVIRLMRLVLLTGLAVALLAARAEASRFELNGASEDGFIVDDDGVIVRTSNSNCGFPILPEHCNVTLPLATDPAALRVQVTVGDNPFALDGVAALTLVQLDIAIVRNTSPLACTTYASYCQPLGAYFAAHPSFDWIGTPDEANTHTLILLPVLLSLSQPLDIGGYELSLTPGAIDFLNALPGFTTDEMGFVVNFTQRTIDPFTLEIASPTAVPEPGTVALVMLGLARFATRRRRQ